MYSENSFRCRDVDELGFSPLVFQATWPFPLLLHILLRAPFASWSPRMMFVPLCRIFPESKLNHWMTSHSLSHHAKAPPEWTTEDAFR